MGNENLFQIESMLYGYYVKNNRLQRIVNETFVDSSLAAATELNIFVDLNSILHRVFSEHYRTVIGEYTSITSSIINLCGHYREFFRHLGVTTRFYLIFSYNCCDINRKFVSGYNDIFYNKSQIKMFRELADNNFELLNTLTPYLPGIYFIKSTRNYEVSVIMAHIINTYCNGQPNMILSTDVYAMQLCTMFPNTCYLYPKKSKMVQADGSYASDDVSIMIPIIERSDFRNKFWTAYDYRIVRNNDLRMHQTRISRLGNISPVNMPLLLAMTKFEYRDIGTIMGIPDAVKIISSMVGSEDIKIIPEQLYTNEHLISNYPVAQIESRYKALDVSFMLSYYSMDPEAKSLQFKDLRDDAAVNTINAKFFQNDPIYLHRL